MTSSCNCLKRILGLRNDMSDETINKQFRQRVKIVHPDKWNDERGHRYTQLIVQANMFWTRQGYLNKEHECEEFNEAIDTIDKLEKGESKEQPDSTNTKENTAQTTKRPDINTPWDQILEIDYIVNHQLRPNKAVFLVKWKHISMQQLIPYEAMEPHKEALADYLLKIQTKRRRAFRSLILKHEQLIELLKE